MHIKYGPFLGENLYCFSNGTECARSVRPSVRLYVCSACVCEHLSTFRLRPYHDEHTRSRPITEVKNHLKIVIIISFTSLIFSFVQVFEICKDLVH